MEAKKLALAGCGFLGNILADAYAAGLLEGYELVGAYSRTAGKTAALARKTGCKACASMDELLALRPDYVAEMASVQLAKEIALPVLANKSNLILLSTGALADAAFRAEVEAAARENGVKVYIASGAVGGFDVLQTIALMARAQRLEKEAGIVSRKSPEAVKDMPGFSPRSQGDEAEALVFSGTAPEAIELLPGGINVAVAASLAADAPDSASVEIFSVPGFTGDGHCINAEIDGVKAVIDIYSRTAAIAGWSVAALLRNLAAPIVF